MTSIGELRRRRHSKMAEKQDLLSGIPALMGRAHDQVLDVDGRAGYIHIRIGHEERPGQAYWLGPKRYDLPCLCGYDGLSTVFRVLRLRQESYTLAGFDPIPEVDEHGDTHTWPNPDDAATSHRGTDVSYIQWRQILDLRVYIVSGFIVGIGRWPIRRGDTNVWIVAQTLDLEADKPGSGARYVTVYLDSSGILQRHLGSIVAVDDITIADAPLTVSGEWELANVLMWSTQTGLQDDHSRQDIIDRRFPAAFSAAPLEHTITGDLHTDAVGTPVEGDVLIYMSSYWRPQPASGGGGGGTAAEVATPRWHADGPLAILDEVDGIWRLAQNFRVDAVIAYLADIGSAGTTTVDVDKSLDDGVSWATLFSTQADRPSITGGGADHVDSGTPTTIQSLIAGTWLRMNIEAVGTGARNLTVQLSGVGGESVVAEITHLGCG